MSPLGTFLRGGAPRPNAAPAPLRITLARRLVETPSAPFVPSEEVFGDVASARDELGLLPASQGPTVVRVQVEGGTAPDRRALAGDWLVDPDGGERVTRLPVPRWTYSDEAKEWNRGRSWLEAWETCEDATWMLAAATQVALGRLLLVLAACACARTALPFVQAGEERPLRAIEAAERWARGEVPVEEVRAAASAAWDARAPSYAAYAAAYAAWAVDADWNDLAATANAAANAAAWAVDPTFAAFADSAARTATLARCADLVRREIPTLVVLRAVAVRA